MKTKFLVVSRDEIEDSKLHEAIDIPHILISIFDDEGEPNLPSNTLRKETLFLKFHDIDLRHEQFLNSRTEEENKRFIIFDTIMADKVLKFVESSIRGVELILINCHAGICRSVATAAALSKILNNEDDKIFKSGIPNMRVYSTILENYFLEENFHLKWPNIYSVRETNLKPVLGRMQRLYKFKRKRNEHDLFN